MLSAVIDECTQLMNIIGKSIVTAKANYKKSASSLMPHFSFFIALPPKSAPVDRRTFWRALEQCPSVQVLRFKYIFTRRPFYGTLWT